MTYEQLRAFVAVVNCGSFRSAANELYKTQSSISAAVRALEDEFSLQLLDRSQYRPLVTAEGKQFYQQAARLLKETEALEELGHRLADNLSETLSISLSAMCSEPPRLEVIRSFFAARPKLRLNIFTEHLSGVLEQLELDAADFAIGPHTGLDACYESVEISQLHMVTVATKKYLPAHSEGEISQSVLRACPQILTTDTGSRAPFQHVNVISGGRVWYVSDYQMKKTLLTMGMGWSRVPIHMVASELEEGKLIRLQVENFPSESWMPIYLIRRRDRPLSLEANELWDAMLKGDRAV